MDMYMIKVYVQKPIDHLRGGSEKPSESRDGEPAMGFEEDKIKRAADGLFLFWRCEGSESCPGEACEYCWTSETMDDCPKYWSPKSESLISVTAAPMALMEFGVSDTGSVSFTDILCC